MIPKKFPDYSVPLHPWVARCMHAEALAKLHKRSFVWALETIEKSSREFGFGFWDTDPRVFWARDDH